jgi:molybdate transport system substrate-binding protein
MPVNYPNRLIRSTLLAGALLAAAVQGCGKAEKSSATATHVLISTAASTKETIEILAEQFHTRTGVEVKVNPGPSSSLANQIIAEAPVDLFLSANQAWADKVAKHDKVAKSTRLITNDLVLVVAAGNPGGVERPQDLLRPEVKKIALAGEKVPAGIYADQALAKLELLESLTVAGKIARGQDVRSALSYVERGEAEAGIVYSTDLLAASSVKIVHRFDPALHDEIVYVLCLLQHAEGNAAARQCYEFLISDAADAIYTQRGFRRLR